MDGKTPREAGHAVKIAVKSLNAGKVDIEEVHFREAPKWFRLSNNVNGGSKN